MLTLRDVFTVCSRKVVVKPPHKSGMGLWGLYALSATAHESDLALLSWLHALIILNPWLPVSCPFHMIPCGCSPVQFAFFELLIVDISIFLRTFHRKIERREGLALYLTCYFLSECLALVAALIATELALNPLVRLYQLSGLGALDLTDPTTDFDLIGWVLLWIVGHELFCFLILNWDNIY